MASQDQDQEIAEEYHALDLAVDEQSASTPHTPLRKGLIAAVIGCVLVGVATWMIIAHTGSSTEAAAQPSTILRFSVRGTASSDSSMATGTLIHHSGGTDLQVSHHGSTTTVVGDVAHVATTDGRISHCTSSQHIPGFADMLRLLAPARGSLTDFVRSVGTHLTSAPNGAVASCPGEWWQVNARGEHPCLCLQRDRILAVHLTGMHVDVSEHTTTKAEAAVLSLPRKCSNMKPLKLQRDNLSLQSNIGAVLPKDATLHKVNDGLKSIAVKPTKHCVFIHGVGNTPAKGSKPILTGSFAEYWGKVEAFTPQCLSRTFLNVETVVRGWDQPSLQEQVCRAATYDTSTGTSSMGTISNRIIFTHSMGNMMMAGAVESKRCTIDSSTSSWYEVSGPMWGSKMASALDNICGRGDFSAFKFVATKLGYCDGKTVSQAYKSLEPNYPGLAGIAKTIAPRLSGAMCGTSAYGLASVYSVELAATAELAGFAGLNDGVVPWSSCSVEGKSVKFHPDYREAWYSAVVNHIDSSCYEGDGWYGDDRKPCSWYSLRR